MSAPTRVCWLCQQRDGLENLEQEDGGKRPRYAHLSCKEEVAILERDFLRFEAKP